MNTNCHVIPTNRIIIVKISPKNKESMKPKNINTTKGIMGDAQTSPKQTVSSEPESEK